MWFNWFDFIVVFGIIQGLISSVVLIFQKVNELHRKLLVGIILVLCVLGFKIEIHTLGLWNKPGLCYFPLGIDMLIQPLLFLYVCSLTRADFIIRPKLLLHFVPFAIFFIHSILVYIAVLPFPDLREKDSIAGNWYFNQVKEVEDVLSVASAFIYGYLCFVSVRKYQRWLYKFTSDTRYPTLSWLRNLMLATAILGLGLFINVLIDNVFQGMPSFHRWQFFYLYLTFLIYYLGIKGLTFRAEVIPEQMASPQIVEKQLKYEPGELEAAKLMILKALVEDKIFMDNELTLQKMSDSLGLSQSLVSVTTNQLFDKTFRSMINGYRVEEVKIKLLNPDYAHLSFLGIALACGFSSEASFYRIFKAEVGCSPKEFVLTENRTTL